MQTTSSNKLMVQGPPLHHTCKHNDVYVRAHAVLAHVYTCTSYHCLSSPSPQISGTSYSTESEQAWLLSRYDQLKAVAAVLTPAHERLLKAIDTRNLSDFVYVHQLYTPWMLYLYTDA